MFRHAAIHSNGPPDRDILWVARERSDSAVFRHAALHYSNGPRGHWLGSGGSASSRWARAIRAQGLPASRSR